MHTDPDTQARLDEAEATTLLPAMLCALAAIGCIGVVYAFLVVCVAAKREAALDVIERKIVAIAPCGR